MREELGHVKAERDSVGAQLVTQAELAGARLRLAEVDVPAVLVVAGQDATAGPHTTATTSAAQRPVQGLWRRLRRVWGRG